MKHHKPYQRIMALALAVFMLLGVMPVSAAGISEGSTGGEITAFKALPIETANQAVPLGTLLENLDLPKNLNATVRLATGTDSGALDSGTQTTETSIPVTWASSPMYDGNTEGTYVFTGSVTGFTLAAGVRAPQINVKVGRGSSSVSIGQTTLQDGKYYTQSASPAGAISTDTAPTDGTPYLYYNGGVLTVTGSYVINPLNCVGPPISIHSGTLTIAGSGKLTLESALPCVNFAPDTQLVLSGAVNFTALATSTAPAMHTGSFRTADGYSGNIRLEGEGSALLMKQIDLNTTGSIEIYGKGSAPIVSCYESIQMTGSSIGIQNIDHSNPASNGILVSGEKELSLTTTKGPLALTASSRAPLLNVKGNITLSAVEGVSILNYGTDGIAVDLGSASKFTITQAKCVEIYGLISGVRDQTDINIQSTEGVQLRGGFLLGNTGTCTVKSSEGNIEIVGEGSRPVFSGKSLTLDAKNDILVQRNNDSGSTVPIIFAARQQLTSKNSVVVVNGSTGSTITTKDGQTIQAAFGGYVTNDGLRLSTPPTKATLYIAGEGYILYTPAQGATPAVLALTNATIDTRAEEAINLSKATVTMQLSGKNILRSSKPRYGSGIQGTGSLTVTSSDGGTLDIESANYAMSFEKAGGSTITIGGNASVSAVSYRNPAVIAGGNLTVEPNAQFAAKGEGVDVMIDGTFHAPNFNGSVMVDNGTATPNTFDFTIYGACDMPSYLAAAPIGTLPMSVISLHIPSGSQMTIPHGLQLLIMDMTKLKLEGKIVNNSMLILPVGTTSEQIRAMKLTGTGCVFVPKSIDGDGIPSKDGEAYTNDGKPFKLLEGDLKLDTSKEVPAGENKGYTWMKSGEGDKTVWTLNVSEAFIRGSVILPDAKVIEIRCAKDTVTMIDGYIEAGQSYACNLTFTGSGSLNIGEGIGNGVGGTVTVQDSTRVICGGSINFGGSGGTGSTLNVIGKGTSLGVSAERGSAVYCETVNVGDGATLNTSADSIGVRALKGVNITGGSTLTASCTYGVYIIGGKLTMDESSKLITNGSVAPFCIVDATSSKKQGDVLSLAGVPSGMEIASVKGTQATYWSLVKTGGSLQVSDENNEPVTLTGAVQGERLDFSSGGNNGNNNNGSSGGSSSSNNDEEEYWDEVIDALNKAHKGNVVKVNAKSFDKMPWDVMQKLYDNKVGMLIEWTHGKEIHIPAGKAINPRAEAGRIYYPLSYLEKLFVGKRVEFTISNTKNNINPETGGVIEAVDNSITTANRSTAIKQETPADTGIAKNSDEMLLSATPEAAQQSNKTMIPILVAFFAFVALGVGYWCYKKCKAIK